MAAEGDNIVQFTYTGAEGEVIPDDATHVFVDVKIIPVRAFRRHHNIIEVICHDRVEKIELGAFDNCPRLRRVIMPGVKIAVRYAFYKCEALTYVECGKLEIVGKGAFRGCKSLRNIHLPTARIVEGWAFEYCKALTDVKFGSKLERLDPIALRRCTSLERIIIPLKYGMIATDNIFQECVNLKHVDLVERSELCETIAALHMEDWRNDMCEEITTIQQVLPNAPSGRFNDTGEKAQVVRRWIRSVLDKMIHYKAEHERILDIAGSTLVLALPRDIVMKSILSFLELPSCTFESLCSSSVVSQAIQP